MALETRPERESAAPAREEPAPERPLTAGQWLVAVFLGLFFLCIAALAVRHVELVSGRYIVAGVPPIPAVAALLLLIGINALLRRLPGKLAGRLVLDRRQILLVFSMLCLGVVMNGQYVVRAFLPHVVSLQYWQSRNNSALARWVEYLPSWYAPADKTAIEQYFEGTRGDGGVPWLLWAAPILRWLLLFIALFVVAASLMALLRRQWLHYERLSFPLLYLPLALTAPDGHRMLGGKPLFRNPLLWGGVGFAVAFNALNIAHVLNPAIPAPGFMYRFAGQFPDPPWTPFNTVMLTFMLEAIGIGYFLPLEVSFSTWFFYLAEKFFAVGGLAAGYDEPGFPFMQDQSAGAILAVSVLVLYGARKHLAGIARRSLGLERGTGIPEEREERNAFFLFLGGCLFILGWAQAAGFALTVAVPFFLVLLAFVLVYARLRAETGVPFEFTYPYGLPKELVVNAFTPRGVLDAGGARTWVAFSSFAWLSRHHYVQASAAYTIDALKLADESRTARRWFYGALAVSLIAGLGLAFWSHLTAYYDIGSNLAGGGRPEYRGTVALQEYQQMATRATTPVPRNDARVAAQLGGGAFALLLGVGRAVFVKSPFHPLGYILATAYGDHTTIFFPMLAAWSCKGLVIRAGGLVLFRRLIPFFLGLIVGHYSAAGIFWPIFSLTLAPEVRQSYHLYFGG